LLLVLRALRDDQHPGWAGRLRRLPCIADGSAKQRRSYSVCGTHSPRWNLLPLAELIGAVRSEHRRGPAPCFVNQHTSESGHQLSVFWVRMKHGRAQRVSARAHEELPANDTVEAEPEERASLWARLTIGLGLLLSAAWSGLLVLGIVSLLKKLI